MFQIVNGETNIEKYKCSFVNLALPYFGFSEPLPPKKTKYNDTEWTLWDRLAILVSISLWFCIYLKKCFLASILAKFE